MRKRRKRPRRKNKRTRRAVRVVGIFVLMVIVLISGIFTTLGRNMPSADADELPDYVKSAGGGYFQWPTPELNEITSKFAAARKHPVFGITRAHNGVDISGNDAMGSPVVAIGDGVVISVNLNGGERGINIRIQHNIGDDVWISRYQHLSVASAAVGQKVTKGDPIGTVGNSGICTGPHLHLELSYNGVLIDPLLLIKK